jgi:hypothetical protein
VNGAKILGRERELGRVRAGWKADLLVVNGNPLENLKVLYPTGTQEVKDGKLARGGAIEWTIKDGIPYAVSKLMDDVKEMARSARRDKARPSE